MIKLKKLSLSNFCGYKDFNIDLLDKDNQVKKWTILFGPNGTGKSNFLEAVRILTNPSLLRGRRDTLLFFRKMTYSPNYLPGYEGFDTSLTKMRIEALFDTPEGNKRVIMQNELTVEEVNGKEKVVQTKDSGLILDEMKNTSPNSIYIDADNPMNMQKFQLNSKYKEEFLDFAKEVYGLECQIPDDHLQMKTTREYAGEEGYIDFCTDFIIVKKNGTKVHFRSMSAGERKIATMLRSLFNQVYKNDRYGIILIDNVEMHIYYKRHMKLMYKLGEYFGDRQLIVTTHSPVIIDSMDKNYLVDLEDYI